MIYRLRALQKIKETYELATVCSSSVLVEQQGFSRCPLLNINFYHGLHISSVVSASTEENPYFLGYDRDEATNVFLVLMEDDKAEVYHTSRCLNDSSSLYTLSLGRSVLMNDTNLCY